MRELELAPRLRRDGGRRGREAGEGEDADGVVEGEAEAELTGSGAEDAAAKGGIEGMEAVELEGEGASAGSGRVTAAAAPNGGSREDELGEELIDFGLPA